MTPTCPEEQLINLQVTFEGIKGSKAKHNKGSWKVFFHSFVPVSAFHRIIDDGA